MTRTLTVEQREAKNAAARRRRQAAISEAEAEQKLTGDQIRAAEIEQAMPKMARRRAAAEAATVEQIARRDAAKAEADERETALLAQTENPPEAQAVDNFDAELAAIVAEDEQYERKPIEDPQADAVVAAIIAGDVTFEDVAGSILNGATLNQVSAAVEQADAARVKGHEHDGEDVEAFLAAAVDPLLETANQADAYRAGPEPIGTTGKGSTTGLVSVTILGPNLGADTETFHVHAAGCADIDRRYRKSDQRHRASYPSLQALVEDTYQDIMAENEGDLAGWEAYVNEFKVFPCVTWPRGAMTVSEARVALAGPTGDAIQAAMDPGIDYALRVVVNRALYVLGHGFHSDTEQLKLVELVAVLLGWPGQPYGTTKKEVAARLRAEAAAAR